ncbi:Salicylate O-methyltransferase [Triticum urartu]|uniref:Salicylate O-methyltransferase n=2 Tax=Triticum urartu TaxID=4572 RepID=M8A2Z3_TRIUA|nr:Salicylate O-methyltransferase [Triticum urartu]
MSSVLVFTMWVLIAAVLCQTVSTEPAASPGRCRSSAHQLFDEMYGHLRWRNGVSPLGTMFSRTQSRKINLCLEFLLLTFLVAMKMEHDLHMTKGEEETSYFKNSRLQEKALVQTKPVLQKIVMEMCVDLLHPTMTIVDLGCSSSDNTLFFVSNVIEAVSHHLEKFSRHPIELQFFLNDLPGNDFNHVFQSLQRFNNSIDMDHKGEPIPAFYIAGLPSSYYTRLLPRRSVHLFHSSYCLHWRSRLPDGLEGKKRSYPNEGNIGIGATTPPCVVKMYKEQFQKDMLLFLQLRHEELVANGQMVLTFLGRKHDDVYRASLNRLYGLLSQSVQSLVEEGLVEKEKLDSFNLAVYGPSMDEVKAVVDQSQQFELTYIKLFETNWDPYDDSEGNDVHDSVQSGINVANCLRAVMEPLFTSHFGESVLDELFKKFAYNVALHLVKEKTKYSVITLSLKRR